MAVFFWFSAAFSFALRKNEEAVGAIQIHLNRSIIYEFTNV